MIRRITGIILGVAAFFIVYWLTGGMATPATPNWALSILVGLVVALVWPWVMGLLAVRRVRQRRQNEIDEEVQKQLAQQQNKPPSSSPGHLASGVARRGRDRNDARSVRTERLSQAATSPAVSYGGGSRPYAPPPLELVRSA